MSAVTIAIRDATENDLEQISVLFFETITNIGSKDYTPEQIELWRTRDMIFWIRRFSEQHFMVAEIESQLVGFCSLTVTGYIDFMYVHKAHQGQGIASMLLHRLEQYAIQQGMYEVHSDVSITAKPFFLQKGFCLTKQNKKIGSRYFAQFAMMKKLV